ncbi:hypothetical protein FRAAL0259 [Frankia alni ACN14a]|uniref:Uncharacterized protein n=1 Tax=Frankia alni (strain DSM 45986 / CECT 9034 / ACN14a) TaxID=326424 RepID=Q0RAN2_FRAAA|nr:hypothetical protein FRAAL0259 [Frankia alni ACN14a]
MAWPDLTAVPEGAVTRVVWAADDDGTLGQPRFASSGQALVPSEEARHPASTTTKLDGRNQPRPRDRR